MSRVSKKNPTDVAKEKKEKIEKLVGKCDMTFGKIARLANSKKAALTPAQKESLLLHIRESVDYLETTMAGTSETQGFKL